MLRKKLINRVKRIRINNYPLIAACIFIIGIVAVSLWPVLLNRSYYSTDKNQAYARLERIVGSIHPPSTQPLYTDIRDRGCDSNGVGLASYVTCSLIAEKYFRADGDPKAAIERLDDQLTRQGFASATYSNDNNLQKTLAVPRGTQEGSAPYTSADKNEHLTLYVEFFNKGDTFTESYSIEKLIENKKLPYPSTYGTYFGIHIQKDYWKCNSTSVLELYCPLPPSEPK